MSAEIAYRRVHPDEAPEVRRLLAAQGWVHRVPDEAAARRLVEGAETALGAWIGDTLVGFGRAITDRVSNGYLSTVVVDPHHRGRGIGRALVERLMGTDPGITWILRAGGSVGFWEHLGFKRSTIAMERVRTPHPGGGRPGAQ